jgi:hypothetical protein
MTTLRFPPSFARTRQQEPYGFFTCHSYMLYYPNIYDIDPFHGPEAAGAPARAPIHLVVGSMLNGPVAYCPCPTRHSQQSPALRVSKALWRDGPRRAQSKDGSTALKTVEKISMPSALWNDLVPDFINVKFAKPPAAGVGGLAQPTGGCRWHQLMWAPLFGYKTGNATRCHRVSTNKKRAVEDHRPFAV